MEILDVVEETMEDIVEPDMAYLYLLSLDDALTDEELGKQFKEVLEQIEEVADLEKSFIRGAQIAAGVGVVGLVSIVIYNNKDNISTKYKEWKHKRQEKKKNKKLEKINKETTVDNG